MAEFLAAPWDATASGDDCEGALPMHQLQILDGMEQRHFAGAAEEGEGTVTLTEQRSKCGIWRYDQIFP
ncbi:hypothetical protein [Rhizobium leguminosarum]|uniref:hypothetical protein n=1 Tax=Rhizobium leguminosarum TaxID=384 RepID=UPI0039657E7C